MLPVYEAVGFERILTMGGRTKPWLIFVSNGGNPLPFVVKLFTSEQIKKRSSVECEILGNVLAKEFDLPVPAAALVHFPKSFIKNLPFEAQIVLTNVDNRIKFGTFLIEPANPFFPSLPKWLIQSKIDIESAFAFDNLIRNRDRGMYKPNILLSTNEAFLIDHELGFERIEDAMVEFRDNLIDLGFSERHIFYPYLRRAVKQTVSRYFDDFEEHLKYINIRKLNTCFLQLEEFGYVTRKGIIAPYLNEMKQNSSTFVKLLRGNIK